MTTGRDIGAEPLEAVWDIEAGRGRSYSVEMPSDARDAVNAGHSLEGRAAALLERLARRLDGMLEPPVLEGEVKETEPAPDAEDPKR